MQISFDLLNDTATHLVAEFLLHVLLDTSQHEWLENHVQSSQLLRFERPRAPTSGILNIFREPLRKLFV